MTFEAGPKLLREWISRAARRHPAKPWLIAADDGRTVSYGELVEITGRIGTVLQRRGIAASDRVALLANNSVEHLLCYLGVMGSGATICTIHVEMNRYQLDDVFARLKPKLVLCQEGLGLDELVARLPADRISLGSIAEPVGGTFFAEVLGCAEGAAETTAGADDDAVILFTSGTTARPKGVMLSYREHLANIDPTAEAFAVTGDDRLYDFRSFNWSSAQLLGALVPVNRGATLVLGTKFSASRYFDHIRDHRVSVATGNPTVINILLNTQTSAHRDNLPALRFVTSSSAPLSVEEWRRFEARFGVPVAQAYGSSETGWIAVSSGHTRRHGSVGRPLPYQRLGIVTASGKEFPPGQVGEVQVAPFGDHPYRCLSDNGTIEITSRGRYRTGDLGFIDEDAFLHLTGREKELIIRGGVNISPLEIDGFLIQHPSLVEVATIGVPDTLYGQEVVSYVVAREDTVVDTDELIRYCRDRLGAFKAPKTIVLTSTLPKTERGKLDRRALARQWEADKP